MKGTGRDGAAVLRAASRILLPGGRTAAPGGLLVSGGTVRAAGPLAEVERLAPSGTRRIDLPGSVLLPGLVNAHVHLQMAPLPGTGGGPRHFPAGGSGAGDPFTGWLLSVIGWRRTAAPDSFSANLAAAAAESIASGTTAAGEISGPDLAAYGTTAMRLRVFVEGIGFSPAAADGAERAVREGVEKIASLSREGGRVVPGVSPHAPYTVSGGLLRRLGAVAAAAELPLQIHLAESGAERSFLADGSGPLAERLYPAVGLDVSWFRGIGTALPEWLRAAGIVRPGLSVVHNVHLRPEEAEELARGGASFVLCPRSNRNLGNGAPDVALFLDRGYVTALGTDGRASVETLSLWDEMRAALPLYRGEADGAGAAKLLLRAATEGGAKALDLPCGALAPGRAADFLAADDPGGEGEAFFLRLVERTGAAEVRHVFVDGEEAVPAEAAPAEVPAGSGGTEGGT
jgi:cytosine/adenosine deaminase-related metal-dependent hydrolase